MGYPGHTHFPVQLRPWKPALTVPIEDIRLNFLSSKNLGKHWTKCRIVSSYLVLRFRKPGNVFPLLKEQLFDYLVELCNYEC